MKKKNYIKIILYKFYNWFRISTYFYYINEKKNSRKIKF